MKNKDIPKNEIDMVNHPPHYTQHPSGLECIDVVKHMNFCIGAAVKYIWRLGKKFNDIEDLNKAIWYLRSDIEREHSQKRKEFLLEYSPVRFRCEDISKHFSNNLKMAFEFLWKAELGIDIVHNIESAILFIEKEVKILEKKNG